MTNPGTSVDLLDDLITNDSTEPQDENENENENEVETQENTKITETQEETTEVKEILTEVPATAMSIPEFAATVSTTLVKNAILAGEEVNPNKHYVNATSVYQTVRAQRDPIPHFIVRTTDDKEPRYYVDMTPNDDGVPAAEAYWLSRADRLSTRGSGTARASSRDPEQNLALLGGAVEKFMYAKDRFALWTSKIAQAEKLIEKYKGFLAEQDVSEDDMLLRIQQATDEYNAEKAEKAKSKKTETETVNA